SNPAPRWYSALLNMPLLANRMAPPATNNMPRRRDECAFAADSAFAAMLELLDAAFDVDGAAWKFHARRELAQILPVELPGNRDFRQACEQPAARRCQVQHVEQ